MSTPEQIEKIVDKMELECNSIREDCLRMTWLMRGGVSYEEVMNMSQSERTAISKIANDNIEVTKKTKLPYF
jgi:hypothetical protein